MLFMNSKLDLSIPLNADANGTKIINVNIRFSNIAIFDCFNIIETK